MDKNLSLEWPWVNIDLHWVPHTSLYQSIVEIQISRIWAKKSCISFLSLHYIVMKACLFPPKIGYVNQMTGCCMLFSWNFSLRRWCSIVLKVGLAALQTVLYYSVEVTTGTEVWRHNDRLHWNKGRIGQIL